MPTVETAQGLTFAHVGAGSLAIGHRPGARAIRRFPAAGVTHVVTVLAETEKPHVIESAVRAAGLGWIWLPLGSTKNLPARGKPEIRSSLEAMADALAGGGRLYLHCSAGLHRTGMIAAALLFHLGYDAERVRATIAAMRLLTATEMGVARFDWASSFATTN
ncbi:MAG: protein-tyrosine phosphatase family protein [Caulobacteraceae bacterium]